MNRAFPAMRPGANIGFNHDSRLVSVRWHQVLRVAARYPVAFRSDLEAAPFRILASFALLYVLTPQLFGAAEWVPKYLFACGFALGFCVLALAHQRLILAPRFLLAPLLLSILGGVAFAYSIFAAPGINTYSSALIPMIGIAMPLLITPRATVTNVAAVSEYVFSFFLIAGLSHVFWQVVTNLLGWSEDTAYYGWFGVPHASTTVLLVYLMVPAGLFRRNLMLAVSVALIGLSLVIRPSSTLVFTTIFAAVFILAHRLRWRRLLRLAGISGTCAILAGNLVALESDRLAQTFYSVEPLVKQGALNAYSNNDFRLGLISAVRANIARHSLLVGNALTGDVTVDTSQYLPWMPRAELPVHSDFILMVMEGGLVGYAVFASLFVGMALLCARAARLAHEAHRGDSENLFDAFQAMNLVFMLYISGNPMLILPQDAISYFLLVTLAVFLARAQQGFTRPRSLSQRQQHVLHWR
jgi:hypothetical protein